MGDQLEVGQQELIDDDVDVSAGLKLEVTDVRVVDNTQGGCEKGDAEESEDELSDEGMEKYKEAFSLLWPDGNSVVHKDKLLQFFKSVLGPLYNEEMANCLVGLMELDEDGNISLESFAQAFSLSYWSPESVAAMHEVLSSNPDLINKLADWKNILTSLGMDTNDSEVAKIVAQAQKGAAALLDRELAKAKERVTDNEEVTRRSSEILDTIREKMHLMDIGNVEIPADPLSSGERGEASSSEFNTKSSSIEKLGKEPKAAGCQIEEHPAELSN